MIMIKGIPQKSDQTSKSNADKKADEEPEQHGPNSNFDKHMVQRKSGIFDHFKTPSLKFRSAQGTQIAHRT